MSMRYSWPTTGLTNSFRFIRPKSPDLMRQKVRQKSFRIQRRRVLHVCACVGAIEMVHGAERPNQEWGNAPPNYDSLARDASRPKSTVPCPGFPNRRSYFTLAIAWAQAEMKSPRPPYDTQAPQRL